MKQFKIDGYKRITKAAARRLYNAGAFIRIVPAKLSPVSQWAVWADIQRETFNRMTGDGFNTIIPISRDFETVINCFKYYNCNSAAGVYPAYYVKEG